MVSLESLQCLHHADKAQHELHQVLWADTKLQADENENESRPDHALLIIV